MPREIYQRPVKRFTAEFIGANNLFDGRVAGVGEERVTVDLGFAEIEVDAAGSTVAAGADVCVSIRSELLRLLGPGDLVDGGVQTVPASYVEQVYLGLTTSHLVNLPNGAEVTVRRISEGHADAGFTAGQDLRIGWNATDARLHTE